jgi:hypothetical protein
MKKPLLLAASGFAGLAFGFAGCGDDKENGGGTSTTFPTVSTGTTEGTTPASRPPERTKARPPVRTRVARAAKAAAETTTASREGVAPATRLQSA